MGSLAKRKWLFSGAIALFLAVYSWSNSSSLRGSSSLASRWLTRDNRVCRSSLAATAAGARFRGFRNMHVQLDGYDTCGCRAVQAIHDPFYSSSGTYSPSEMESDGSNSVGSAGSVLLLSHGRLQKLDLATRHATVILHRPGLRIRGVFVDGNDTSSLPTTYVLLTTPSLDRESRFMGIDGRSGKVVYNVPADGSMDGHDVVRHGDEIYVVSTGTGELRVYDGLQPGKFPLLRVMAAADPKRPGASHINTVGISSSSVWVLRHNQGKRPAEVHVLDRYAERSFDLYADVGRSSHGLAHWREELVVLDSLNGRLLAVHRVEKTTRVVWSCGHRCFLKGLAVVGNLALVGVAPPQSRMNRMYVNCSLVALSLDDAGKQQWRMDPAPGSLHSIPPAAAGGALTTMGLLNQIVPLPYSNDPTAKQSSQHVALIPLALKKLEASQDVADGTQMTGYRMLGGISISNARAALQRDWTEAWTSPDLSTEHLFAPGLNARFPGVQHLRLLFSTGERIESLCVVVS